MKKVLSALMALFLVPTFSTNAVELTMRSKELLKQEKRPTRLSVYKGSCGEKVKWALDPNTKSLVISGSGDMYDYFDFTKTPWYNLKGYISTITIEKEVTSIGESAFQACINLTKVFGCVGVATIGRFAFADCHNLTSFVAKPRLSSVGEYAFLNCFNLKQLVLSDNVTTLGNNACDHCTNLEHIDLPSNLSKIDDRTFLACKKLKTMTIGSGITSIGSAAFESCETLTAITLPETVHTIGFRAFAHCESLREIKLPTTLETIGNCAFWCCRKLSSITLPEKLNSIGSCAFASCYNLASIIIPENTTTIGSSAFESSGLTTATIKADLKYLGGFAFKNCRHLKNIYYHGTHSPTKSGRQIFENCSKLKWVTVPQNYKNYFFCWHPIKKGILWGQI